MKYNTLKKEVFLLEHGFYDDKVWDWFHSLRDIDAKKEYELNARFVGKSSEKVLKITRIEWFKYINPELCELDKDEKEK